MTTRTSPKTPYEIRLELLQLSFDLLVKKHEAAAAAAIESWESGKPVHIKSAPTTEEVIAEAEKMNMFVSKANQSN